MQGSLFHRLLWSALLLAAIELALLEFLVPPVGVEMARARLEMAAKILAGEADAQPASALKSWAGAAAVRAGARVAILEPGGAVLADSQPGAPAPGIHVDVPLHRPGEPERVLRLTLPPASAGAAVAQLRWRVLDITLAVMLLAAAAVFIFSRRVTARIARLKASVEGLVSPPAHTPPEKHADLAALAESLASVAAQVKQLVDKVRVEGARRDAILTGMVEGVLAVDHELRVTFCNVSFARAIGLHGPVAPGVPVLHLVRNPDFLEVLRTVLTGGESVKQRMQLPAADGRSFEVQAAPLEEGSPTSGAMAILHDITDLERLERVRKDFVANVSHELRTPLTAIRGYAETLLDGALDDPQHRRRFVEIIQSHAIRLNNIASDLLALSELESGRPAVAPGKLSVVATLEAAMRTVESEAEMRQVSLGWGTVEDVEVMGNKIKLEQAFVNLLDNAVKFNRPGGEVWVEACRTAQGMVRVTIADSGIGIPSQDLPRIFERFYRVDKARSRAVGGTGLGLSIVKHVVEQMQGTVSVESQLGKGSRFMVFLPQA
jgi:two-component system, OmpR family, phosphate regulon sensor histidine kinase PhoR